MSPSNQEPKTEPCEICGDHIEYGFSLCNKCEDQVKHWNEETGNYHMKDGRIIDTTKFLHLHEGAIE